MWRFEALIQYDIINSPDSAITGDCTSVIIKIIIIIVFLWKRLYTFHYAIKIDWMAIYQQWKVSLKWKKFWCSIIQVNP